MFPWWNTAENSIDFDSHPVLFEAQVLLILKWGPLCRKLCVITIPRFFCLASATNPFSLPNIDSEPSMQLLMHDVHDKLWNNCRQHQECLVVSGSGLQIKNYISITNKSADCYSVLVLGIEFFQQCQLTNPTWWQKKISFFKFNVLAITCGSFSHCLVCAK